MLLERLHGEHRWANEAAAGWGIADLDVTELVRTMEEAIRRGRADDPGTRDPAELLRGLGLMRDGRVLRAAAVLFGRSERLEADYPQCLLRLAKFRGTDRSGLVRAARVIALEPAHRPRFFRRGMIESWGRGTIKMAELVRQAGLPVPEIEDSGGGVTVRFWPTRYVPPQRVARNLTERQRHILALLEANRHGLPLREIRASLSGAPPEWEVKADLALLKQLELIRSQGYARGAVWILANQ